MCVGNILVLSSHTAEGWSLAQHSIHDPLLCVCSSVLFDSAVHILCFSTVTYFSVVTPPHITT